METRLDWWAASEQVGQLSGQIAQLHAQLIATTAQVIADEAWAGDGIRSVEHFLEFKSGLDRSTVRKIVKVARRVEELPETVELLSAGRLTLDQAAVVAEHAPASHSVGVARFAENATVAQLRRALAGWFHDPEPMADGKPVDRPATLQLSHFDGQFLMKYTTGDQVAAELVEQAIREAKDALFKAGHEEATLADGLVEVASRSLGTVTSPSRQDRFRVLVHLDTDRQAWLHKQGALPRHIVDRYTCDGDLIPVWETDGKPVAVGRTKRVVPNRVRRLIEDRDKGCRYPGCYSTAYLEVHHKDHWRDGGVTDPSNLLCLCGFHHDEHHRGAYTIEGDPQQVDGLVFRSHYGYVLNPARPEPPPRPVTAPPLWRGPTGEPLQTRWLHFEPNPEHESEFDDEPAFRPESEFTPYALYG
ncbi:MAG: DUF222 domain-containing protein [Propionibacteriaceae bacterium]|nr:DUF222 domain-containing protein [Propionibacteriaceae bacterium]